MPASPAIPAEQGELLPASAGVPLTGSPVELVAAANETVAALRAAGRLTERDNAAVAAYLGCAAVTEKAMAMVMHRKGSPFAASKLLDSFWAMHRDLAGVETTDEGGRALDAWLDGLSTPAGDATHT